ncbi:MAG: homoserine O-succinyltransferase [Acetobacteraceae bacterium]|nr:homoserine O-succinyltransferase [Acetobacteraceae bacterium]
MSSTAAGSLAPTVFASPPPLAIGPDALRIALVNIMPDAALVSAERRFGALLRPAAGERPIRIGLTTFPEITRGERAARHIAEKYEPIGDLWRVPPAAIVVTGAEPRASDLRQEVYWPALTTLLAAAAERSTPMLLSCLAAHAAVLFASGIARVGVGSRKCFGVFEHTVAPSALTRHAGARMRMPHSRWNALPEAALMEAGYEILCRSDVAGVGLFTSPHPTPWLLCQSHPEYESGALLLEYRRDLGRFLRGEQACYPELPLNCLTETEKFALEMLRKEAMRRRDPAILASFPVECISSSLANEWRAPARAIIGNWLAATCHAAARQPCCLPAVTGLSA